MKRIIIFVASGILLLALIAWFWPLLKELRNSYSLLSTRILDRNGKLLYTVQNGGMREYLPLNSIPKEAVSALVATEDRTFYSNSGLSFRGILRATIHNFRAGHVVEGGSTITQQLVRTLIHPQNRGWLYKIMEAWLALKLNSGSSKDKILEQFLNSAYFGQQAYGLKAAARTYFDKDVASLSIGENALLIGLLNAPSSLNPFRDPLSAKERRAVVLRAMRDTNAISGEQMKDAMSEPVQLSHGKIPIRAPHFVFWLLQEHSATLAGKTELKTTLDLDLQEETERIIQNQLQKLKDKNVSSAAVVVLDAKNGDILALVGSADYFDDQHDGAVNVAAAPRQPGSALKPFTYALAFMRGMTAATTVSDIETQFFTQEGNPYIPRNYDYGYHGLVRLREALANSYNIAAVKVLERVGVPALLHFLQDVGISTLTDPPDHYGLALTLGDSEVKLLELARAYGVFARNGETLNLRVFLDDSPVSGKEVLNPRIAWLVTDILSDNDARISEFGENSPLSFDFPVAAKTGTTRNSRDNWTIGFTPDRIVGVWVGNADNTPMRNTSGITGAGPIFHDVMLAASRGIPPASFLRPDGIEDITVCRLSGKLPTGLCPATLVEHFISGTEPKEPDDIYQEFSIDSRTGLLASSECENKFVKREVFAVFPPELRIWARENGWKTHPAEISPLCRQNKPVQHKQDQWLTILRPHPGASFHLDPLIPGKSQLIPFEAQADDSVREVEWRINGNKVGIGKAPDFHFYWAPKPGRFTVQAVAGNQNDSVRFEIIE